MHILWHPRASAELEEAAEYYEVRRANLGQQFIQQVEAALELVKLFPNGWPRVSERSRRIRTRRFPYGVVYQVHTDYIRVICDHAPSSPSGILAWPRGVNPRLRPGSASRGITESLSS